MSDVETKEHLPKNGPEASTGQNNGLAGKIVALTAIILAIGGLIDGLVAVTTRVSTVTCNLTISVPWCPVLKGQLTPAIPVPPIAGSKADAPPAAPNPNGPANTNSAGSSAFLLQKIATSHWCTSRHSYSLQVSGSDIVWKDNVGSMDMEHIVRNNVADAQTVTQRSNHPEGEGVPAGTTWTYILGGADKINVLKNGEKAFSLTRC
jgi:hypothetical protein